jgi:hypothetical protein
MSRANIGAPPLRITGADAQCLLDEPHRAFVSTVRLASLCAGNGRLRCTYTASDAVRSWVMCTALIDVPAASDGSVNGNASIPFVKLPLARTGLRDRSA